MTPRPAFVIPLATKGLSLSQVGGKSRSLSVLACAGLPVPSGFLISTDAYRLFVAHNDLGTRIRTLLAELDSGSIASLESTSDRIRGLFEAHELPAEVESAVIESWRALGERGFYAVRSSATAEDLPDFSFAGQHDSFLGVQGRDAVLHAIRLCWASLWSARAIGYRQRMAIDADRVAMGVIVQEMADAQVSGILFTANPATGDPSELVINAGFGLGEAIVGGLVTPDTFLLSRDDLRVRRTVIGAKAQMIVPGEGSDSQIANTRVVDVPPADRLRAALSTETLGEIASLGLKIEALCDGQPQDIEWAIADGRLLLLQSRPITNLPAGSLPDIRWEPPRPGSRLVRRQVVENMPQPLSTLFEDLYLNEGLDRGLDNFTSVMKLPFDLDAFITRPMFVTVNGFGYCRYDLHLSWRVLSIIPRMIYWYIRHLPRFIRQLIPLWESSGLPEYQATIERWRSLDCSLESDAQLLSGIRALALADAVYWFYITLMVGAAKITEEMLSRTLRSKSLQSRFTTGMFLSGFPSKTDEAKNALAAIASSITRDSTLRHFVLSTPAEILVSTLLDDPRAAAIRDPFAEYLYEYGHQVYDLDFVEPTQGEDPLPVVLSLQALVRKLQIHDNPADAQGESSSVAQERRDTSITAARAAMGPIRKRFFNAFLRWALKFGPYREQALFHMGAAWPTLRKLAFELGGRLTDAGILHSAGAVFFLTSEELRQACDARTEFSENGRLRKPGESSEAGGFSELAEQRQALREARKRLHPPPRVPQDLRFKFGPFDFTRYFEVWETQMHNDPASSTLHGFPVSPGTVTGTVSLILSPADFAQMKPDTILVCPTTTPAWTPLFSQAIGLITDIGGVLAHGSIVAREYGIPAVLGTGDITRRITSGQRVTLNGVTGTVTLID
ncbi:MAG: PEP/pyruvate-binding domain-containing protein [Pseudomonadales bacterium]